MKTTRLAAFIIVAAAAFNASAQDPTTSCIKGLTGDARLAAIADKVGLEYPREPSTPMLQRYASEEERAALELWRGLRRQCFEAGAQERRKLLDTQARSAMESAFIFQQVLLSRLQHGELTYSEFNRRRTDVAESFELHI